MKNTIQWLSSASGFPLGRSGWPGVWEERHKQFMSKPFLLPQADLDPLFLQCCTMGYQTPPCPKSTWMSSHGASCDFLLCKNIVKAQKVTYHVMLNYQITESHTTRVNDSTSSEREFLLAFILVDLFAPAKVPSYQWTNELNLDVWKGANPDSVYSWICTL